MSMPVDNYRPPRPPPPPRSMTQVNNINENNINNDGNNINLDVTRIAEILAEQLLPLKMDMLSIRSEMTPVIIQFNHYKTILLF